MRARYRSLVGLAGLAAACLDPTQAAIEVTTDVPCGSDARAPGELFGVYLSAGSGEVRMRDGANVESRHCMAGDVGTVVVFPEGGAKEAKVVVVGVVGARDPAACLGFADDPTLDGTDCIVARRRVAFVEHTPLRVPVTLYGACAGVKCAEGFTCEPGAPLDGDGRPCVSSDVACDEAGSCRVDPGAEGAGGDGGGGGVGGGATDGWTIVELPEAAGATHVSGLPGQGLVYISRAEGSAPACAHVYTVQAGAADSAWQVCQGSGVHAAALHVLEGPPVLGIADVGDQAFTAGGVLDTWTLPAAPISDLFLRDTGTAYAIVNHRVFRKTLEPGGASVPVTSPSVFTLAHLWVSPAASVAQDVVFTAGGALCVYGIPPGTTTCALGSDIAGEPLLFSDIWGAAGRVVAVGGRYVVTLDASAPDVSSPVLEVPSGEPAVQLTRVFSVEPSGVVWAVGTTDGGNGSLYVARGEPAATGHTFVDRRFDITNTPVSLWARDQEAYVVVDDGKLFRITSPP